MARHLDKAMTSDEVDRLLFTMTAIWPGKISDPTLMVWRDRLTNLDPDIATEAVNQLADTNKRWPSWSEVSDAAAAIKRRTVSTYKSLPAGPLLPKAEALEKIAEMRALLKR